MNTLDTSDAFLHAIRRAPPPEFAEGLQRKLQRQSVVTSSRGRSPLLRAASIAAIVACTFALFSVPSVRAAAQQFLELFRVRNFVAVPVTRASIEALTNSIDLPKLIGDNSKLLTPPASNDWYATPQLAARAAGFAVSVPRNMRADFALTETRVRGAETWQVTVDIDRLREVIAALDIRDVQLPTQLDGKELTFTVPARAQLTYLSSYGKLNILQMPIPTIELPPELDLAMLAEIGLRILGKTPSEAATFAQSVDWRTTLLLPLPPNAESFQPVTVQGQRGLAIRLRKPKNPASRDIYPMQSVLLWTDEQFVHAMQGAQEMDELLALANSMQAAQ